MNEIPIMTGAEFKYIRTECGITLKKLAEKSYLSSRSAIWNWEKQKYMKQFQVKILIEIANEELFISARQKYAALYGSVG